jgi:glucose/arabinose dehydrogenase
VFIEFHGSWNRPIPAGYKVARIKLNQRGYIISHSDFITGWLGGNSLAIGRPVEIEQSPEGDLYLSDDFIGNDI